jgi:hypothetical protein
MPHPFVGVGLLLWSQVLTSIFRQPVEERLRDVQFTAQPFLLAKGVAQSVAHRIRVIPSSPPDRATIAATMMQVSRARKGLPQNLPERCITPTTHFIAFHSSVSVQRTALGKPYQNSAPFDRVPDPPAPWCAGVQQAGHLGAAPTGDGLSPFQR